MTSYHFITLDFWDRDDIIIIEASNEITYDLQALNRVMNPLFSNTVSILRQVIGVIINSTNNTVHIVFAKSVNKLDVYRYIIEHKLKNDATDSDKIDSPFIVLFTDISILEFTYSVRNTLKERLVKLNVLCPVGECESDIEGINKSMNICVYELINILSTTVDNDTPLPIVDIRSIIDTLESTWDVVIDGELVQLSREKSRFTKSYDSIMSNSEILENLIDDTINAIQTISDYNSKLYIPTLNFIATKQCIHVESLNDIYKAVKLLKTFRSDGQTIVQLGIVLPVDYQTDTHITQDPLIVLYFPNGFINQYADRTNFKNLNTLIDKDIVIFVPVFLHELENNLHIQRDIIKIDGLNNSISSYRSEINEKLTEILLLTREYQSEYIEQSTTKDSVDNKPNTSIDEDKSDVIDNRELLKSISVKVVDGNMKVYNVQVGIMIVSVVMIITIVVLIVLVCILYRKKYFKFNSEGEISLPDQVTRCDD